ncbi:hypothetical protein PIB30_018248 [Stylosanthes scabra]|uniref:Uncharacterized protein n=1 Tax=Stylosanthes scabra TaxID=79078 RepID=A0ABU6W6D8_9FABA|nr:hypothetical protein [Stylosanthes scabra]
MRPVGGDGERNGIEMVDRNERIENDLGSESTLSSRFHKLPRIESSRLVPEPIRFHTDFKFNVQKALRIDSSSSESIPMRIILIFKGLRGVRGPELGLRQQRTIRRSMPNRFERDNELKYERTPYESIHQVIELIP